MLSKFSRYVVRNQCKISTPKYVIQRRTIVSVHNEWDPVEEIIVGSSRYANYPGPGDKLFWKSFSDGERSEGEPTDHQLMSQRIIDETEEDISVFTDNLKKLGIKVRRPEPIRFTEKIKTFDWEVEPFFCYCPRDLFLAIGNTIIECPSGFRARYLETFSYHKIMYEYLANGSRWISAPKGRLADDCFDNNSEHGLLSENEMIFDAANILRFGKDIMYQVSESGNELGAKWLQSTLGSEYKVHCIRDVYYGTHIDTTMTALRPGLLLLNPTVDVDKLPPILKKWEILKAPDMVEVEYPATKGMTPFTSKWLGMNMLMLSPTLAAVDSNQTALIKLLESRGIDVMPTLLRHGRYLGGGPHCITLDTRRKGTLESYF